MKTNNQRLVTLSVCIFISGATWLAAGATVFQFPEPHGAARSKLQLDGQWELARFEDPNPDRNTYEPIDKVPSDEVLQWLPVAVPKSLYAHFGATALCHRVVYRTQVYVPTGHRGRGFTLHFSGSSWILSVFVNGQLAGTHRGMLIPWDMDVSGRVRPGQTNNIVIAVKSPWYGFDTRRAGVNAHEKGSGTLKPFMQRPSLGRPLLVPYGSKGDGNGNDYGLVNSVTLIAVGPTYTEDVCVKPSVAGKRLETDVTLRNTTDRDRKLQVSCEAIDDAGGNVAHTFPPVIVTVPTGRTATITVAGDWPDAKLWWPVPNPNLYRLRTTLRADERVIDVHEQLFGFREVSIDGTSFLLNGVRWNLWGWWGIQKYLERPEQYAEALRAERTRFNRFFSHCELTRFLPAQEDRLTYYDRHGIAGCQPSMIEGMGIAYVLSYVENRDGRWTVVPNAPVWDEFRRHMAQIAKAYRNHPSVLMYSLENETVYINAQNLYGHVAWTGVTFDDYMRVNEEAMASVAAAAQQFDDTKPYVVSGAGDLGGLLPMNTPHYPMGSAEWYPENAYSIARVSDHVSRWPWKRDKPWYVPESTFAGDIGLATYAIGDAAFRGMEDTLRGKAVFQRMLYGGYRWTGVAGWSCCGNLSQFSEVQDILSDLVAIPRRQTSRLYAGRDNTLLFKIMNDTFSTAPVTFAWSYTLAGACIASNTITRNITPGFGHEETITITPPATEQRVDGQLAICVSQTGATPYEEVRAIPTLPAINAFNVNVPVTVFDRSGIVTGYLARMGVRCDTVENLQEVPTHDGLLLIGPDTLSESEAYGQDVLVAANRGQRVIVLEQETPVGGGNLPIPLASTAANGGYAHPQGLGTPIFRDLGRDDLIDWSAGAPATDVPVYKHAYQKPVSGARSLAHCGPMLPYSALVEVPCGKGIIVLCQLRIGRTLGLDPAADVLLRNMLEYYAITHPAEGVAALVSQDAQLAANVQALGLRTTVGDDLNAALDPAAIQVAIIQASLSNLTMLAAQEQRVQAFQDAGGWIMLCGLAPDGIEQFNALVNGNFMLRPFRLEQVTFEGAGQPLGSTLGNQDVSLLSAEDIMHGRKFPSWNTFSYVVDARDIAPFCRMPNGPADPYEYEPLRSDKDPYNFVNGLFNSLSWRCIQQIWWPGPAEPSRPLTLDFTVRRPDIVASVKVWNNDNYATIRDMDILFDGNENTRVSVVLPEQGLETIELDPPRAVSNRITLRARTKTIRENKNENMVGIENVQFLRPVPPAGAVYLDNVGGLVAMPRGKGGWFLNQVKFLDEEPNKANIAKKRNLLCVLLQNMGVGSIGRVGVPGVNVRYTPINLMEFCNQYRDSRWVQKNVWFGQSGQDLGRLQTGDDGSLRVANVDYQLVRFMTAPKQDCIMLGPNAPGGLPASVNGIPVGRTADLLFFLHTANVLKPISADERRRMTAKARDAFAAPELFNYVIHYIDGQTVAIPVLLGHGVDHWVQSTPLPLEQAQIAWAQRLDALEGKEAVLYSMKVVNPRPDIAIKTIDVVQGKNADRAVPAVLAISTGVVRGNH